MVLSKVKSGDIIFTSEPFAYALLIDERELCCHYCCQRNNNLKRCTGCRSSKYCSKSCQKKGWKDHHKRECKLLSKSPFEMEWHGLLMLRIILKLQDPSSKKHEVSLNGVVRHFDDLMTHEEEIQKHQNRPKLFRATLPVLEMLIGPQNMPNKEECFKIFCKIVINAHYIEDKINGIKEHIGVGIYLGGSAMNHSCLPTACSCSDGANMIVVALEDIEEPTFKNVTADYINCRTTPTAQRKARLKQDFYFDCQCRRCLDEDLDKMIIERTEMMIPLLAGDVGKKSAVNVQHSNSNIQQKISFDTKTQPSAPSTSEAATDKCTIEAETVQRSNSNIQQNVPSNTNTQVTAPSTSEAATDKCTIEAEHVQQHIPSNTKTRPTSPNTSEAATDEHPVKENTNGKLCQVSRSDPSLAQQDKVVHLCITWLQQQIQQEAEKHALQMKVEAERLRTYEQQMSACIQEQRYWQERTARENRVHNNDDDDYFDY